MTLPASGKLVVQVPIDPYPCPVCSKLVTIISPSWLQVSRHYQSLSGEFAIRPHALDPCMDCLPPTLDMVTNRVRRNRMGLDNGFLVYHQTGMLAPTKVSRGKPVRRDEYFLIIPTAAAICDISAFPLETIRNADGQALPRLFSAVALSVADIPSPLVTYWRRREHSDGVATRSLEIEADDRLSLRQRLELIELTTLVDEIPGKTDHTRETVERQLAVYLAKLPKGKKPNKSVFVTDVLEPRVSARTWENYMKHWHTNWRTMVYEAMAQR